jgi:hypothetical protein
MENRRVTLNQRYLWEGFMRKLIVTCAMIVLVAGSSVQAQKKGIELIGPPIPFNQTISIEDDATGSFLVFDTGSRKYKFTRCNDSFTITGAGFVKVDGCSIYLEDVQTDHRVVASVNECDQQGKAIVETFAPVSISPNSPAETAQLDVTPFKAFLSDQNLGNNLLDCAPKTAR